MLWSWRIFGGGVGIVARKCDDAPSVDTPGPCRTKSHTRTFPRASNSPRIFSQRLISSENRPSATLEGKLRSGRL
jgi:hypothetical protein